VTVTVTVGDGGGDWWFPESRDCSVMLFVCCCFLKAKYLYWLEARSLCKSMLEGVVLIAELEALV
jgi:hypothetical protein